jgi:hypothetical protein
LISLRPRGHARSAAAPGVLAREALSGGQAVVRCRTPASFRLRCSTASNSEEYEVESSADSKTLEPLRPGSTAVVPEPPSPLRSTSFPDRRGGFRSRSSPHTLELSAPGRTMMRRAGVTGCLTDPETSGSTRDPQLPWGSCCIRKTFWRLPVCYSNRHRHAHRSRKFSGVRDPVQTPGTVTRAARPSRVTGLSKSRLFGQQSRRFRVRRIRIAILNLRHCLITYFVWIV